MPLLMEKIFFDQPIKNDFKTYDNIRNIATGQGDDYTTRSSLNSFLKKHKLLVIELHKQQKLDADPEAIQH